MNLDGSEKRKILDTMASNIYFYNDCFNFIYVLETKVFKTNTSGSDTLYICDLRNVFGPRETDLGFNPNTDELLVIYESDADSLWKVATYNIATHAAYDLLADEKGYEFCAGSIFA